MTPHSTLWIFILVGIGFVGLCFKGMLHDLKELQIRREAAQKLSVLAKEGKIQFPINSPEELDNLLQALVAK